MTTASITADEISELNERFAGKDPSEILAWALERFGERITLACSLGREDTALLDMAAKAAPENVTAQAFVLDTGRLHEETYETLMMCRDRYAGRADLTVMFPKAASVEALVRKKGPYSFYDSIDNRKECCGIRKVEPLRRALADKDAWITGLRRAQSVTRTDAKLVEIDEAHGGILKINPLVDWSTEQVQEYVQANKVPVHPLHAKGFPSIGCQPCTRAIQTGEDERAGRWWWEDPSNKECGLHVKES